MPQRDEEYGRTRSASTLSPEDEPVYEIDDDRSLDRPPRRQVATFGGEFGPGGFKRALRDFVRRYGWRAYALPVLVLVSIAALLTARSAGGGDGAGGSAAAGPAGSTAQSSPPPPVAQGNTVLSPDTPGSDAHNTALAAAALPAGAAYTAAGKGTFRIVPGTGKVVGTTGKLFRYSIDVEDGVSGIDMKQFANLVQTTFADKRSWAAHGVRLQRVDSGTIDFHITMTSSMTVRKLCGYDIPIETSCYIGAGDNSAVNRVVVNNARWVRGAAAYLGDIQAYRLYVINHEDGHAIGHGHAHECLPGSVAPVMMQQTIGLKDPNTGKMCTANPWPYPPGVKGAPGAEQPDTPQNSEFGINGD